MSSLERHRQSNLIVHVYQTESNGYNIPEDIKLSSIKIWSRVVSDNSVQKSGFSALAILNSLLSLQVL